MPSRSVHFVIVSLRNVVVIPQWDAVDLEIGAVLAHANCWRKFAISCNSSGLKFAALHESAFDAVDGSSTGTRVPSTWSLLRLPRFGGAKHASGHNNRF